MKDICYKSTIFVIFAVLPITVNPSVELKATNDVITNKSYAIFSKPFLWNLHATFAVKLKVFMCYTGEASSSNFYEIWMAYVPFLWMKIHKKKKKKQDNIVTKSVTMFSNPVTWDQDQQDPGRRLLRSSSSNHSHVTSLFLYNLRWRQNHDWKEKVGEQNTS
jgi:hypothetical protein